MEAASYYKSWYLYKSTRRHFAEDYNLHRQSVKVSDLKNKEKAQHIGLQNRLALRTTNGVSRHIRSHVGKYTKFGHGRKCCKLSDSVCLKRFPLADSEQRDVDLFKFELTARLSGIQKSRSMSQNSRHQTEQAEK